MKFSFFLFSIFFAISVGATEITQGLKSTSISNPTLAGVPFCDDYLRIDFNKICQAAGYDFGFVTSFDRTVAKGSPCVTGTFGFFQTKISSGDGDYLPGQIVSDIIWYKK